MCLDKPDAVPTERDLQAAWRLFVAMHEHPSRDTAERLIDWLRTSPRHVRALDEALTLWALAGASMLRTGHPVDVDTERWRR